MAARIESDAARGSTPPSPPPELEGRVMEATTSMTWRAMSPGSVCSSTPCSASSSAPWWAIREDMVDESMLPSTWFTMLPAVLAMSSALWAPDCLSEDELMCWCRRLDTTEETSEEMRATKGPMTCRAAPRFESRPWPPRGPSVLRFLLLEPPAFPPRLAGVLLLPGRAALLLVLLLVVVVVEERGAVLLRPESVGGVDGGGTAPLSAPPMICCSVGPNWERSDMSPSSTVMPWGILPSPWPMGMPICDSIGPSMA
mmetsp:Transcript_1598/g.3922  ORF Transcript_1598/g.3922 Transcript_1598/m.3922 type:complete len:256 (-) Transcript_1598:79-846(-)